jgi:hypothetical protein
MDINIPRPNPAAQGHMIGYMAAVLYADQYPDQVDAQDLTANARVFQMMGHWHITTTWSLALTK